MPDPILLPQPHPTLIGLGPQTVVVLPSRPDLAPGDRVVFAADGIIGTTGGRVGRFEVVLPGDGLVALSDRAGNEWPLPRSGVVSSAVVGDVVPIVKDLDGFTEDTGLLLDDTESFAECIPACFHIWTGGDRLAAPDMPHLDYWAEGECMEATDLSDQLAYAGFVSGSWAVLLTNGALVKDRCPTCWGTGMVDNFDLTYACPRCGGSGLLTEDER